MLTEICVDAVLTIKSADEKIPLDLHMVELMEMQHRAEQVTFVITILTLCKLVGMQTANLHKKVKILVYCFYFNSLKIWLNFKDYLQVYCIL